MDCSWISWCTLKPEAQAAWAQAILSVAAILVAACIPWWQSYLTRRTNARSLIELIAFSALPAILMRRQFEGERGGPRLIQASLEQLRCSFESINYLDIPDRTLAASVQQAATAVSVLLKIQNLFIEKGGLKKKQVLKIVLQHIELIDVALADAMSATGIRPRPIHQPAVPSEDIEGL